MILYRFVRIILLLAGLFILSLSHNCYSQVKNDLIQNRLELKLNASPYQSNTTNCKVEQACVDESLTGKCIEYHNDQWFWFKTNRAGTYYININGQSCRDTRGVQLVVIDGVPCQPKTYQVLSCTLLASQDDIFVQLDSLKANYRYLLIVDGYLEDFCDFKIQLSTKPMGLPTQIVKEEIIAASSIASNIVHHTWTIPTDFNYQVNEYYIMRRQAFEEHFTIVNVIPHLKNTSGSYQLQYSSTDTLSKSGIYYYKIIASGPDQSNLLLKEETLQYQPESIYTIKSEDYLTFKLNNKVGTPISIYIFKADTENLITKTDLAVQKKNQEMKYYVGNLKKQGINKIKVKITNHKSKVSRVTNFTL